MTIKPLQDPCKHSKLPRDFSLYLDVVRFLAALTVVFSHSSARSITGGFLWQAKDYGQTAVMTFFVLSGYVIAYVTHTKERNPCDYVIARVSRLYSIVIPAILLTIICNVLGNTFIEESYSGYWDREEVFEIARYIATFFMLQDIWSFKYTPANNGPFWSITYEAFYYALFAVWLFVKTSTIKYSLLILLSLAAGPWVLMLLPIWLLGYYAYKLHEKQYKPSQITAYITFFFSWVLLVLSPVYRQYFSLDFGPRASIIGDYIDGIAFFLNIFAAPFVLSNVAPALVKFQRIIRYLGGLTFALYLLHLPLLRLLAGVSPFNSQPFSSAHIFLVLGTTLSIIFIIGPPLEKLKTTFNVALKRIYNSN